MKLDFFEIFQQSSFETSYLYKTFLNALAIFRAIYQN